MWSRESSTNLLSPKIKNNSKKLSLISNKKLKKEKMKLLLTGASVLMTVDTDRIKVLSASVLPTKTTEGIQGEEKGYRSSQGLLGRT